MFASLPAEESKPGEVFSDWLVYILILHILCASKTLPAQTNKEERYVLQNRDAQHFCA
jgi:hypothetical protein